MEDLMKNYWIRRKSGISSSRWTKLFARFDNF